jgi:quinolinate synthase
MKSKIEKLNELKKAKNAVILAHYYTLPEVQNAADFLGDSLFLAQKAKETQAEIILFCGVNFMAETAKILNPSKKVLIPDKNSFCSLAESVDFDDFTNWKNSFENPFLISYINCSTKIKAVSDVICTSANVVKIAENAPKNATILFATDKNLGNWINKKLNLNMKLWNGNCEVHQNFSEEDLQKKIKEFPEAEVVAHPECPENLLNYANFVGSTTGILNYIKNSAKK